MAISRRMRLPSDSRRSRAACRIAGAVLGALVLTSPAAPAEQRPTFETKVTTVVAYATVLGADGRFIPRLEAKDFEIRDDGQLQAVTTFGAGTQPITLVMLLDNSPSMRDARPTTRAAASAFIHRLLPADRATIGTFDRSVRIEGALTSDRETLLDRMNAESPLVAGTAMWDALNAGMSVLAEEAGRRVVLVLSDGDDNSSEMDRVELAARAIREGVLIYAIGIKGGRAPLGKGLKELALETGGAFIELKGRDDLARAFQQVADELHNQYVLGFAAAVLDQRTHRLEVKVKRRGATVRARRSYLASAGPSHP